MAFDVATLRAAIEVLSRLLCEADCATTITIPVSEHCRLLDCERASKRRMRRPQRSCPRSPIDRDDELAAFIEERAGRMLLGDIVADCRRTFGPNRAPSKSAIWRFIERLTGV